MTHYALVFPGQGSQSLNMLQPFAQHREIIQHYCAKASTVLGYDMEEFIRLGPEAQLNQTEYTQPALLVAGVIAWEIWKTYVRQKPAFLAGHSLGEYTALTCAGSIIFEDAVHLVQLRAQYMQTAVPEGMGAMAAIVGLDNNQVVAMCQSIGSIEEIAPANFNSTGQIVVAGTRVAVEAMIIAAKQAGAKIAVLLPMSVPSHCHLMLPAAQQLQKTLERMTFYPAVIPVMNNADVTVETTVKKIKAALIKQLYSPVRWVEIIQSMRAQQVTTIIECGPGKVLTGLTKRIDKDIVALSINQAIIEENITAILGESRDE